ncbi:MAG: hypothetical protein MnENMB40S_25650 [Rhizobiaceae bacterium MnEN-MB40S]|nr:MAG: hypothetical protein MnENMB40S_25650 [Rhizobiaceae bacterium MnEN-MB40S]
MARAQNEIFADGAGEAVDPSFDQDGFAACRNVSGSKAPARSRGGAGLAPGEIARLSTNANSLRPLFLLSTVAGFSLFTMAAHAGECSTVDGINYECSGPARPDGDDSPVYINQSKDTILVTTPDFGLDTSNYAGARPPDMPRGSALVIYVNADDAVGTGDLEYTDDNGALVRGRSTGLWAIQYGHGDLTIKSTGSIEATNGRGTNILFRGSGAGLVDVSVVDVTGVTDGLVIENEGNGDTIVTAITYTRADQTVNASDIVGATGIGAWVENAQNTTGDLDIHLNNVSGGTHGILAEVEGTGDLDIRIDGHVAGQTGNGILAALDYRRTFGNGIDRDLEFTLDNLSDDTTGFVTNALRIDVSETALVEGALSGIYVYHEGKPSETQGAEDDNELVIRNRGLVRNLSQQSYDLAIKTDSYFREAEIDNQEAGDILGRVELTGFDDVFDNSGVWTTTGTSEFYIGDDVVNNDGLLQAADNGDLEQQTLLAGLENFNNWGHVSLVDGGTGDVLTLPGNYNAASDLSVDVVLGDSSSPSDLMVVDGNVTGVTEVFVNNLGGAGASTDENRNGRVDADEGILFVSVGGAIEGDVDDGDIALSNAFVVGEADNTIHNDATDRENVVAGAYLYDIYAIDPGLTADDYWNIVLASSGRFQPSVPVYEALPTALLALNGMPTLQQRVGNRFWYEMAQPAEPAYVFCKDGKDFLCLVDEEKAGYYADAAPRHTIQGGGFWLRMEGGQSYLTPSVSSSSAEYDMNQWAIQGGFDFLVHESDGGDRLIAGLTGRYGAVDLDVSSAVGNGSITSSGYGAGATLTWYQQSGLYIDLQGQYGWYDSDLTSDVFGPLADSVGGNGYGLSAEIGRRFALTQNPRSSWSLTPQAQIIMSSVSFDSFNGPFGEYVTMEQGDSLRGRLGLSVDHQRKWLDDAGKVRRVHGYVLGNLYYDFSDPTAVNVEGVDLSSRLDRFWGEIGLGGSYNWNNDAFSIYGEVVAGSSLEDPGASYDFQGNIGLRLSW